MGAGHSEDEDIAPDDEGVPPNPRYVDRGRLGSGAMGQVRAVFDRHLERELAMKILSWEHHDSPEVRRRFLLEARIMAGLSHPGIVSVFDQGRDDEGRLWFTMRLVRGKTLGAVIQELHAGCRRGAWPAGEEGTWTLFRVIDAFRRICDAVAYAHSRDVIHRDLKPANLMIGEFGEVQVMDWGIAKVPGESFHSIKPRADRLTHAGDVLGTPAFIPPEQALGEVDRIGPPSDVYALGACLWTILRSEPPVVDGPVQALIRSAQGQVGRVSDGVPPGHPPLPSPLVEICDRAMAYDPDDRHPDASVMAAELGAYLEGARRREQARALVASAAELRPGMEDLEREAAHLRRAATAVLGALPEGCAAADKARGWALEDQAAALDRRASILEVEWLQRVRSALNLEPDLPEAHESLADHYAGQLRSAEEKRDALAAGRAEALLRVHARTSRHRAILSGEGAVTVLTDPPGAAVRLHRIVEQGRRLEPVFEEELGLTPLEGVPLVRGSYLLELRADGRIPVRYPVHLERGEGWSGVPPEGTAPLPIWLPRPGDLDEDEVYVPAGWFWSGGDPRALEALPRRRVWVDAFAISRFHVTNRDYLAFLDDLVARGADAQAEEHLPWSRGGDDRPFGRDGDRHVLQADASHVIWLPDWPVCLVRWRDAKAFARWRSEARGRSYRLPDELEWEKAARGVDGRLCAWGDFLEPSWACLLRSRPGEPSRASVHDFPTDESVYGVRGTVGNAREWCENVWREDGPMVVDGRLRVVPTRLDDPAARSARGGGYYSDGSAARAAGRLAGQSGGAYHIVGFRLARTVGPGA